MNAMLMRVAALCASVAMSGNALAQAMTSTASSAPVATSAAGNQEFYQGITFNSPSDSRQAIEYSGTQTVKNVPSISASALATSNDTCMGSSSGSVSGPGFGVSLGGTWTDSNCKLLKNSRELWNMGMRAAALALMCTDDANREALEITGFECPQTTRARAQAQAQAQLQSAATSGTPITPPPRVVAQASPSPLLSPASGAIAAPQGPAALQAATTPGAVSPSPDAVVAADIGARPATAPFAVGSGDGRSGP